MVWESFLPGRQAEAWTLIPIPAAFSWPSFPLNSGRDRAIGVKFPNRCRTCARAILSFDFNSHNLLSFLRWCAFCHGNRIEGGLQMKLESEETAMFQSLNESTRTVSFGRKPWCRRPEPSG